MDRRTSLGLVLAWTIGLAGQARADVKPTIDSLAEVKGVCAALLTADEIAAFGKPRPPFSVLDTGHSCGVDSQQRTGAIPDFGIYASAGDAVMERRNLAPGGIYVNPKVKITSLEKSCGIEAWSVETPTVRLLVFVKGAAGGNVHFAKAIFKDASVVEKACKLVAPRLGELDELK
jgi:hypothetical protein